MGLRGILGGYARGRRQTSAATLSLNFLAGLNDSRITYSGGTNGTRVNSSGVIVAATTPRFDYDPVTLAARGLLVEEARTNLALRSSEFDNAAWVKGGVTVSADSQISPDGAQNADTVTANVANAIIYQQIAVSGSTTYTGSFYMKAATNTTVTIYITNAAFLDLGSQVCNVTTQWQRFSVTAATGINTSIRLCVGGFASFSTPETVIVWGAQLEEGGFATSYIPTTTAAVTRTADSAVMTGTNFSSWYNQSEGTFVVSGDLVFPANGGNQFLAYASDNSYNNFVAVNDGNSGFGAIATAAGGVYDGAAGVSNAFTANTPFKIAAAYAANSLAVCVDAQTVATDGTATIPTVLTRLAIGSDHAGANHVGSGHIATITYFPRRSANEQLQALTA